MNFWAIVDRVWLSLGSVKLTIYVFILLLLLSIPGTLILQENVSGVDPGLQYDYDFWALGQWLGLFRAYHSFWYIGLIVILAVNLIVCSYERWPPMWKLAFARPVPLQDHAIKLKPDEHRYVTELPDEKFEEIKKHFSVWAGKKWIRYSVIEDDANRWQAFWQTHQLARMANYVVHTSLLVVFAGAIWSGLYGFEGTLNIPEGAAVDTFLMYQQGSDAGLERPPNDTGLLNERMMDIRLEATSFNVDFYPDFPGRPKDFATHLNAIERKTGRIIASKTIRVNDPLEVGKYTFYQSSYMERGDYRLDFWVIRKSSLQYAAKDSYFNDREFLSTRIGQVQELPKFKTAFVPTKFAADIQGHGPGVQIQQVKGDQLIGEAFWVLKSDPVYDFGRDTDWALVLNDFKPLYITGLQVAYDPGAPVYWLGCLGMLIGTFYALFWQHKKFYFIVHRHGNRVRVTFTGTTHRLPYSFEAQLKKMSAELGESVLKKKFEEGSA